MTGLIAASDSWMADHERIYLLDGKSWYNGGPNQYIDYYPGDIVRVAAPHPRFQDTMHDTKFIPGKHYSVEVAQQSRRDFDYPHVPIGGFWVREDDLTLIAAGPYRESLKEELRLLAHYERAAERQALQSLGVT